jgi:hypothetical protein
MANLNNDQFRELLAAATEAARGGAVARINANRKVPQLSSTDPEDWREFRNQFTEIAHLGGWDAERSRRELRIAIVGEARVMVEDIDLLPPLGPGVAGHAPLQAALNELEVRFTPPAVGDVKRVEFLSAKQEPEESIRHWQGRVRSLYRRAHPGVANAIVETQRDLLDRFILGLFDDYVRTRTWEHRPLTMTAAGDFAFQMTSSQKMLSTVALSGTKSPGGGAGVNALTNGHNSLINPYGINPALAASSSASTSNGAPSTTEGTEGVHALHHRGACDWCGDNRHAIDTCRSFLAARDKARRGGFKKERGSSRRNGYYRGEDKQGAKGDRDHRDGGKPRGRGGRGRGRGDRRQGSRYHDDRRGSYDYQTAAVEIDDVAWDSYMSGNE